jgi:Na+/H+ antiporter NhaD/arsenite permease-like protein
VGITHVLGHIFSNIAHQGLFTSIMGVGFISAILTIFHGAPFTTFLTGTAFDFAAKIRKIKAILPAIIMSEFVRVPVSIIAGSIAFIFLILAAKSNAVPVRKDSMVRLLQLF